MKMFFLICFPLWPSLCLYGQKVKAYHFPREDSSRIRVHRLNFNSEFSDFSPFVHQRCLYFVSAADRRLGIKYENVADPNGLTDIFYAEQNDSIHFKKARILGAISSKFNEGPFCISRAGDEIFFTGGGEKTDAKLRLFYTHKNESGWSKPEMLSFCDGNFNFCHPSLSADGNYLFFSSDMPGGYGGTDIYVSIRDEKGWSKPSNAGTGINSTENELFPFVSEKNYLFFSSKRKNGAGGLDIYSINWKNPSSGAKALAWPINSEADDYGIWIDSTLESGYFSSNRSVLNSDDIYHFVTWIPDFNNSKKPLVKNKFCYNFFEENVKSTNDTSNLSFEWNFGDGNKFRGLKAKHCYDRPGTYLVQLNIVEKVSGEIFRNESSYDLKIENPPQLLINCRDTVDAGSEILISSEKSALRGYEINNVYWSFGDGKYNKGHKVMHNYCKTGSYNLELLVVVRNKDTKKHEKFKIEKKILVKEKN